MSRIASNEAFLFGKVNICKICMTGVGWEANPCLI